MSPPAPEIDYFNSDSLRQGLKQKTVRGGISTGTAQAFRVLIGLIALPILARLLDPADFGLVAMVTVFTGFANMFVDAGLSMATIQRDKITRQQISNLFWISVSLGLLIAITVALVAPAISWLYGEPRLTWITRGVCLSYVFSGLTLQHHALLRRGMQFHLLAFSEIVAVTAGQLSAIGWAWHYRGLAINYWALVIMPVTIALVKMVCAWLFCHWRPGLPKRSAGTRDFVTFGANLTIFSFVNYFARNADNMLIGLAWGKEQLGYYERAYRLFLFPINQVIAPISGVSISALSRRTQQGNEFSRAYYKILRPVLFVLCPLVVYLILHAEIIVRVLLGDKWLPVVPMFRALACVGLVQPFSHALTWSVLALGKGREVLNLGIASAAIKITAFLVGLPWGPLGVAISYATATILIFTPYSVYFATSRSPLSANAVLGELGTAIFMAVAVCSSTLVIWPWLHDLSPLWQLFATMIAMMIGWAFYLFLVPAAREVWTDTLFSRT